MKIDKIFIINLENRTDRKAQVLEVIKNLDISEDEYEFFKAIKPSMSNVLSWTANYCGHVRRDIGASKFDGYRVGCLGCLRSHVEVCKLALSRGYKNILVLEDDTEFVDAFDKLALYSKQIEDNYDMLYLSGSHLGECKMVSENVKRVNGTHTTGAYCIGERVMKYLVDNITSYDKEIDVFYAEEIQSRFNCFCVHPHMVRQRESYSDIQQNVVSYKL
jgi:GR25 family glycosyltransferase involved in LPS biosynthesis